MNKIVPAPNAAAPALGIADWRCRSALLSVCEAWSVRADGDDRSPPDSDLPELRSLNPDSLAFRSGASLLLPPCGSNAASTGASSAEDASAGAPGSPPSLVM
ncbi:MAG TPA: hypothetical protein VF915_20365, partial [Reyranella sp.]